MKLAGAHGSIALVPRRNSRAAWPGLLTPSDHTCGWTTSTLHSHLAWRYWFRWGCSASLTTSFIADLAGGHIPYPRSTGPDHAALHPLRRAAPVTSRCTRSEGVQCLRIGCNTSSVTSLHVGLLAGAGRADVQQTQAARRCTTWGALHHLRAGVTPS